MGDVNNDGLLDIFLTANMETSRLYINKGDLKFEEVTAKANITDDRGLWATGANMVDVNADGWLDIYVCYTGSGAPTNRRNKLYINLGDGTFVEKADAFGLDDPSYSVQSAFFDYDRDGDLDMYLLNYNADHIPASEWEYIGKERDKYAGDKLYRNEGGIFVDVSEQAGIKGNPLGYGLGIAVADINGDFWPDIYVSNDFIEPDYLYINNGDGTFTEAMSSYLQHISHFSMGSDVQDINNDLLPDVFSIDMLPADNKRQKLLYGPDNYEQYARSVMSGYYHQNMRNMLHLNNGNGSFSEIGQLAGISNTDWSWSSLFADYNNDGWKDLLVTNGYAKDVTDRDFLKFRGDYYFDQQIKREPIDTLYIVEHTSSTPVHNYIFMNTGNLSFSDKTACWGLEKPGFSNGAAYGDLDNDGDLDLVINNINSEASVYENKANKLLKNNNFLSLQLLRPNHLSAYNSKVMVYANDQKQLYELMPVRGFQSRVSDRLHIGLGTAAKVDSIEIMWPDERRQVIYNPKLNTFLSIKEKEESAHMKQPEESGVPLFVKSPYTFGMSTRHTRSTILKDNPCSLPCLRIADQCWKPLM